MKYRQGSTSWIPGFRVASCKGFEERNIRLSGLPSDSRFKVSWLGVCQDLRKELNLQ